MGAATPRRFGAPAPTRVLHLLSGAGGGSTLSTIELSRALAAQGIEHHAACFAFYGKPAERQALVDAFEGRVTFLPLYFWNRRTRTAGYKRPFVAARQEVTTGHGFRSAAAVRRLVEDRRIDLVHTATFVLPDGAVAARSLGLPHVFHVRELVGAGQPFQVRGEGRRLGRVLTAERQCLVANSRATATLLADAAPGAEIELVPNGLDLTRFAAVAAAHDPAAPVRVVGMVGHLHSPVKRHDLFVDAAAIVARRHPDIEFRIYGHRDQGSAGSQEEALVRRAADQGLTTQLVFAGFVADPAEVMHACDVLVQPTSAESFGRAAVEAMAAKVAVVGVAEGALAELVEHEHSGLLAPAATAADLAAVIEGTITDTELRVKVVEAAHERASELFSVERCAARMGDVYERLLRLGRGPGEPLGRSWARFTAGRFFG
jgi:glycosyltransferase involved in cell wall biosynthesis